MTVEILRMRLSVHTVNLQPLILIFHFKVVVTEGKEILISTSLPGAGK